MNAPRRGFSLMEVLLALAIFSIAILGIIEGSGMHLYGQRLAEDTTRAAMLAQNIIEEIRYTADLSPDRQSGRFTGADADFAWYYELTEANVARLYRLAVVVTWSDGKRSRDFRVETFLCDRRGPEAPA